MAPTGAKEPTIANAVVEMTFSHDLILQTGWTLLTGAIAFAATRRGELVLVAVAWSLAHWLRHLVAG
jgi:hypothetical protein